MNEQDKVTTHSVRHPKRSEGSPKHGTVPSSGRSLATLGMTCEPLQDKFYRPEGIYLLSHSIGLLPKKSESSANRFFNLWKTQGSDAWNEWLLIIQTFCNSLATLLNGAPNAFCPQTNISSALVKILYSLPVRKGRNKIILSELDFPSTGFVLQQAKRLGYQVKFIKPSGGESPLETWRHYLQHDVQLALITHVYSENNQQNPVSDITKLTQKNEIYSVVDIAQSVGLIPIDLNEWCADFVVGSSIKWLCGGSGAAFMWMNINRMHEFSPVDVGWFSHENPFEFDIHHFEYAESALRFLGGTPSILPLYVANSSINNMMDIGIDRIYQHNQRYIDTLLRTAFEHDLVVNSPREASKRGGTLVIQFQEPQKAVQYLRDNNMMIDVRPRFGVRFSPHIYTTESDIQCLIQALINLSRFP